MDQIKLKRGLIWLAVTMFIFLGVLRPILVNSKIFTLPAVLNGGKLNVSALSLEEHIYTLEGEVATYANLFVPVTGDILAPAVYEKLPHAWKMEEGVTYGSYQWNFNNLLKGKHYGLYFMDALSSYRIYVDGELIGQLGVPSESPDMTEPQAKVQAVYFVAKSTSADVRIHAASHSSQLVGIWQKIQFGARSHITDYWLMARQTDAFVLGGIFLLMIYMWIHWAVIKGDRAVMSFAILCTVVVVKSFFAGQQLGFEIFPKIPYEVGLRLAYMMVPLILISTLVFFEEIFSTLVWKWYVVLAYVLSGFQLVAILVLSQQQYQATFYIYQLFVIVTAALLLVWSAQAVVKKMDGALIYTGGYLVFSVLAVNDVLYSVLIIKTGFYLGFGLLTMILTQATILALRMRAAIKTEQFLKENLEEIVKNRTQELEMERNRFETLSKIDNLTQLFNKGYILELLQHEVDSYQRYHGDLSLIILDIDHFKQVNDTYGHILGDDVLREIAKVIGEYSRRTDFIGRFGGEEFLMVLRFTSIDDAALHAEQLRRRIEAMEIRRGDISIKITVSFGVTSAHKGIIDEKQLINEADEALYQAKAQGRNCVVVYKHKGF